jgi:hypothetical protein
VSPAFDCFLLFALLNGMILGHDADRRHPCPDDHAALAGVVSRLRAPPPARCGSPVTCWRRLRDWQRAGCISYCLIATATPTRPVAGTPAEAALGRWAHDVVPGGS